MRLTIRWHDGNNECEMTLESEFADGDVIDLPKTHGEYFGDAQTGEIVEIPHTVN